MAQKSKSVRVPRYCLHRATGQAYVTLAGREVYLGKFALNEDGAPNCPQYHKLIGEWLGNGCRQPSPEAICGPSASLSVKELVAAYWIHATGYYKGPDGQPTGEVDAVKQAMRPLKRLFGETAAAEFGPKRLKMVRAEMIRLGWCRNTVNRQTARVRQCFRWGVAEELIPGSVEHALRAVTGLRLNPAEVRESERVPPAPQASIDAVLPLVSKPVGAMIRLQILTGMRSGEVTAMRTGDVERQGDGGREVWTYRPARHKTAHHGIKREVPLGPQARNILRPFLKLKPDAYIFSPAEAESERFAARERAREGTKLSPSRKAKLTHKRLRRKLADRYTPGTYRRAIARACDDAFPLPADLQASWLEVRTWADKWTYDHAGHPPQLSQYPKALREKRDACEAFRAANRWHPHQLRHNAATALKKQFGWEATRRVLQHQSVNMTAEYVAHDLEQARQVMEQAG